MARTPSAFALSTSRPRRLKGTWQGRIGVSEHLGSDTFFHVHMEGRADPLTVRAGGEVDMYHGDTIYMTPDWERLHKFDAQGAADRMKRLEGKCALITGAARGIGLAFAQAYVARVRKSGNRRY
jgi:hypothetical protein